MRKKIFRSLFSGSIAVLLVGLCLVMGALYHYFGVVQNERLESELLLAVAGVDCQGQEYLERVNSRELRLTWVDGGGRVLYDTAADADTMENHADREEIREAMQNGKGVSARYSTTLLQKTLYRAVRMDDGSVLRASVSYGTVLYLLTGVAPWLVLAGVLAALLSSAISGRMTRGIVMPLYRMDLENPLENDCYEELSPLLSRLYHQHEQIEEQMAQLRQKTEEFNHITGSIQEGLVLTDAQGKILSINPAACKLFGEQGDLCGKPFLMVDRSTSLRKAFHSALESGHASQRQERSGRVYQFDISRIDSNGEAAGLALLFYDVSEQADAEKKRREFTANVSHELKTPLTTIIASADLLDNGLVRPEDMPRFVGHIKREAGRLLSLIEDIIRLSQLDEGERLVFERVDLNQVVLECMEQLQAAAQLHHVNLRCEGTSCVMQTVPKLLREIVSNLMENAIKYNMDGGSVTVSVSKSEKSVDLTVSDTGIGIPPEHQERVFERFYRVDKSHSRQTGGTGLGLSIVKHAASCLGAQVQLWSEPGKGTSVTVIFPEKYQEEPVQEFSERAKP